MSSAVVGGRAHDVSGARRHGQRGELVEWLVTVLLRAGGRARMNGQRFADTSEIDCRPSLKPRFSERPL